MNKIIIIIFWTFFIVSVFAQPKWKQKEEITKVKLVLFHGTQTANFQTTESLDKGNWMCEISHRFTAPIQDGFDALWGFDGPARIRFAVGYGITDELMVSLGRSNNTDNYDLQFKQKLFQFNNEILPSVFSVVCGIVQNTEVP